MSWVRKKSLPAIRSISYENCLCNTLLDLWNALHKSYNSVENRPVNTRFLNELPQVDGIEWPPFFSQEFRDAIAKCSSSSTLGPDHCHDLAKRLSHYLYFFSFLFFSFSLDLQLQGGAWESIT